MTPLSQKFEELKIEAKPQVRGSIAGMTVFP